MSEDSNGPCDDFSCQECYPRRPAAPPAPPASEISKLVRPEDPVSCEACNGPLDPAICPLAGLNRYPEHPVGCNACNGRGFYLYCRDNCRDRDFGKGAWFVDVDTGRTFQAPPGPLYFVNRSHATPDEDFKRTLEATGRAWGREPESRRQSIPYPQITERVRPIPFLVWGADPIANPEQIQSEPYTLMTFKSFAVSEDFADLYNSLSPEKKVEWDARFEHVKDLWSVFLKGPSCGDCTIIDEAPAAVDAEFWANIRQGIEAKERKNAGSEVSSAPAFSFIKEAVGRIAPERLTELRQRRAEKIAKLKEEKKS